MFFLLTNGGKANIINDVDAGLAHLVERHLAKVEVASSSLVTRSRRNPQESLAGAVFEDFCSFSENKPPAMLVE